MMASARRECMLLAMLPCRVLNVWCSSVLVKSRRGLSVPCAVRGFRATVPVSHSVSSFAVPPRTHHTTVSKYGSAAPPPPPPGRGCLIV